MDNEFLFYIEVVEGCNLRCPACATGNYRGVPLKKGLMESDLLERIMKKAVGESKVSSVGLFNWGEPLLHPRLPELVRVVRSHGVPCSVSTNLSVSKNFDDLMESNPEVIYISTSGFTQAVYGRTHKGGDIELVKSNMKALAEAKAKYGGRTHVTVMFHRYRGNQQDELLMRSFSDSLGFSFTADHARMTPFEKVLAYIGYDSSAAQLTPDDYEILKLLPIPLDDAMKIALRYKSKPCALLSSQIVINAFAEVQLCCAVYDSNRFTIANYLNTPLRRVQELRHSHPMCSKCTNVGGHVYIPATESEFETVAAYNLERNEQNLMNTSVSAR